MSQEKKILNRLASGKTVTPIQALNWWGCFRLGARIHELRRQGYAITSEQFKTKSGAIVARYRMEEGA